MSLRFFLQLCIWTFFYLFITFMYFLYGQLPFDLWLVERDGVLGVCHFLLILFSWFFLSIFEINIVYFKHLLFFCFVESV